MEPSISGYAKEDPGQSWSSRGAAEHDRSGKPETVNHQEEANSKKNRHGK